MALIKDAGQVDEDGEHWGYGFGPAFKDWRIYVFVAMSNFVPWVLQTPGYSRVQILLLTVPPYIVDLISFVANNWPFHVMWPLVLAIVGFVVPAASLNTGARYFAMILVLGRGHGANAIVLAWAQKTMTRP